VSGTSLDSVAAASVKLTAALAKTDDESAGAALGLKAIGLEVDAFKSLDPVAQIEAVALALAGFEDGAEKTAVAVQLFGRSGADLIPILNDLAEQGGRQVTLTAEQIEAADEYSKSTARLRSEVQTLVQVTAAEAAPAMQQIVGLLRETIEYSNSGAAGVNLLSIALGTARTALEAVLVIASDVVFVFKTLGDTAGAYAAVSVALINGDIEGAKAIGAAYREMSAERLKALDDYQRRILRPVQFGADDQSQAEARRLGLSAPPRRINTSGFVPAGGRSGGGSTARAGQSEAEKAQQDYDAFQRKAAEDLDRYLQNRHTDRLKAEEATEKRYLEDMAAFEQAQAEYVYERNLKRWDDEEKARTDLAKKAADAREAEVTRLGDAFSSTFDRAFREGMKVGDLIKKLAFDAINIQFLTPATQAAGNALGSVVSSLFSFDGGGYTGAGSRTGGLDGRGGFMAMLHPNETVLDHTRGQSAGGGGVTIAQTFNFGNADAATVGQLRAEAQRIKAETLAAVPAAMVQAVRTSTSVARAMRGA
jgi:hypothetical protein